MPSRMTPPPSPPIFSSRPRLIAKTRRRRERDDQAKVVISKVGDSEDDSSDNEEWRSRSKLPRMRMHADDEEKKLEKRLKKSRRKRSAASPFIWNNFFEYAYVDFICFEFTMFASYRNLSWKELLLLFQNTQYYSNSYSQGNQAMEVRMLNRTKNTIIKRKVFFSFPVVTLKCLVS